MGIGDSITLVGCLAGMMLALPALLVLLAVVFGRNTRVAALRLRKGVILPFGVGLVPILGIGIPAAILLSLGSVFQLCGTIAFLLLFLWGFVGLSAISRMMGMQITDQTNLPENVVIETATGAVILSLAIAFPLVGWMMIFPLGLAIGMGGTVLAFLYRLRGIEADSSSLRSAPSRKPVATQTSEFEASTIVSG
jgi:hypothetical protein